MLTAQMWGESTIKAPIRSYNTSLTALKVPLLTYNMSSALSNVQDFSTVCVTVETWLCRDLAARQYSHKTLAQGYVLRKRGGTCVTPKASLGSASATMLPLNASTLLRESVGTDFSAKTHSIFRIRDMLAGWLQITGSPILLQLTGLRFR
jgi:hypothetical protein